jgi:hypothetical protein
MERNIVRPRRRSARAFTFGSLGISTVASVPRDTGASTLLPRARNSAHRVYGAVTLFAGHVFFNEVGVLQPHELDGKSVVDVIQERVRVRPSWLMGGSSSSSSLSLPFPFVQSPRDGTDRFVTAALAIFAICARLASLQSALIPVVPEIADSLGIPKSVLF